MITGSQCRAARALINITRANLADIAGITEQAIEQFEHLHGDPDHTAMQALESALESLGAVFLQEDGAGIGVRLKFTADDARQVAQMEDEGGMPANDKVL